MTMPCQQNGFPDAALVALAITDEDVDTPLALFEAQGQRHTNGHRQALSQGAGRCLDARHLVAVGMRSQYAIPLAELLEFGDREKAFIRQNGVVRYWAMSLAQYKAVAFLAAWVAWIV